jgi:catechol 2,3-dioxygenase-like lactoylglutathione lyase family enzyme
MSTTDASLSANTFGGATPIFCVASLPASIEYYVNALGFKVDWDAGGSVSAHAEKESHPALFPSGRFSVTISFQEFSDSFQSSPGFNSR